MNDEQSTNDPEEKSWIEKISHIFSSEPKTREDLLAFLQVAQSNEVIDNDAVHIMDGAMRVSEMQVREIMVPRTQMTVIKAEQPLEELLQQITETGHSRYPVIGENTDEVLGVLLAKDLLPQILKNTENFDIQALLRPATVVPESKRLNILLREFREKRNHMAIVIDEYGGVAGLVTIEDVLEEIVGEIEDEYDIEETDSYIRKLAENDYIVKALTPIEEFNEAFKATFSDEEFDTIGGIILQQFGHLPGRNEIAHIGGFEFKVLNADNRQVHLLRMSAVVEQET